MNALVILNDPPYGTERCYNGLRLAGALARRDDVQVRVFCFGDAAGVAVAGQQVPNGYYHLDRMVIAVVRQGGQVGCCGSCLDARGLAEARLVDGAHRATLDECADWTVWADKILTF